MNAEQYDPVDGEVSVSAELTAIEDALRAVFPNDFPVGQPVTPEAIARLGKHRKKTAKLNMEMATHNVRAMRGDFDSY